MPSRAGTRAATPDSVGPTTASSTPTSATSGRIPKWLIETVKLVVAPVLVTALGAWLVVFHIVPSTSDVSEPKSGPNATPATQSKPALSDTPFTAATQGQTYFACGPGWMVARPTAAIPPPSKYSDYDQWMEGAKAVVSDYGAVLLTIQGTTVAAVVLTSLQVEVVNRAPALRGTHVYEQCGGPGAVRELDVNLDHDPPTYLPILRDDLLDEGAPAWQKTPLKFPYTVSLTDAETFLVLANTFRCDCQWRIKLAWASQGATGTMVIDDHGKPFRTTGDHNAVADCTTFKQGGLTCGPPAPAPAVTP